MQGSYYLEYYYLEVKVPQSCTYCLQVQHLSKCTSYFPPLERQAFCLAPAHPTGFVLISLSDTLQKVSCACYIAGASQVSSPSQPPPIIQH